MGLHPVIAVADPSGVAFVGWVAGDAPAEENGRGAVAGRDAPEEEELLCLKVDTTRIRSQVAARVVKLITRVVKW